MRIFTLKSDLIRYLQKARMEGKKIGLVPTMGALHAGHLALVRASVKESDLTVSSIFVNPAQFNNPDDLKKYPRTFDQDIRLLEQEGCEVVYAPGVEDLYDPNSAGIIKFDLGNFNAVLEGKHRPGHFNGVALVVSKLFNIVLPDFSYFGQKDLQQYHLIEHLTREMSYNIQIRCVPTVRDSDGLAMSSRNLRIPEALRPLAPVFYQCLTGGKEMIQSGESIAAVKQWVGEQFSSSEHLALEYYEAVDTRSFTLVDRITDKENTALCIAGYLNNIRLIDNVKYI